MRKLLTILAITMLSGNIYSQNINIFGTYLCEYSETIENSDGCCFTTINLKLNQDSSFYILKHQNQGDYECYYYSTGYFQIIDNKIFFISQIPDTSDVIISLPESEKEYFKIKILRNRSSSIKYLYDNLTFFVYDNPFNIKRLNTIKTIPNIENYNFNNWNLIDTITFYFKPFSEKYFNVKLNDKSVLNFEAKKYNESIFYDMTGNYCYWEYYDFTGPNLLIKEENLVSTYKIKLPSGNMTNEVFKSNKNAR